MCHELTVSRTELSEPVARNLSEFYWPASLDHHTAGVPKLCYVNNIPVGMLYQ